MTITVRLPEHLEAELQARLTASGTRLSDFVREAIGEKLEREQAARPSAYEQGRRLFGRHGSGRGDLAENADRIIAEKLDAKRRR
jgi:Arc/MetJ-type ribon-helix-helix transcriptional regulator